MALPPVVIPVRVEKDAALAGIRETEAAHQASLSRMGQAAVRGGQAGAAALGATEQAARNLEAQAGRTAAGFGYFAKTGARSMTALSAGIGAATAAAAGGERQFLSLGVTILSSFAAGGPVAGSLAILAGGIGLMLGKTDNLQERLTATAKAAREAGQAMQAAYDKAGVAAEQFGKTEETQARARMEELARHSELLSQATETDLRDFEATFRLRKAYQVQIVELEEVGTAAAKAEAAALVKERDLLDEVLVLSRSVNNIKEAARRSAERAARMGRPSYEITALGSGGQALRDAEQALQQAVNAAGPAFRSAATTTRQQTEQAQAEAAMRIAKETLRLKELSADSDRKGEALQRVFNGEKADEVALSQEIVQLEEQLQVLKMGTTDEQRKEARELAIILAAKKDLLETVKQINRATADRNLQWELNQLSAITDEEKRQAEIEKQLFDLRRSGASEGLIAQWTALKAREPLLAFLRDLEQPIENGLSNLIVDGIRTGFENAGDIAEQMWSSLLQSLVQDLVHSGLEQAVAAIARGFGGGGVAAGGGLGSVFSIIGGVLGGGGGGGGGMAPTVASVVTGATGGSGSC